MARITLVISLSQLISTTLQTECSNIITQGTEDNHYSVTVANAQIRYDGSPL
jgi:hypothetical protein